ncbi:MAG TPA: T9SS type A sorting domain-containing protein [Chitinophagaceae bacterium]|nr:T9SS type A sorting domain-containing protein [Chitinophagaceae bacterium]
MIKTFLPALVLSCVCCSAASAQFAPQVGLAGSTAIHKGSPDIKAWASSCTILRGLQQIDNPSLGYTTLGDASSALGTANGEVVSLGDSGVATISFVQALYNGPGADFAVFENAFQNPADKEEAFLELAFVEVSSDGKLFFRFPATSNTPTATQIKGAGDYMNARLINNLAGKYVSQYGTPFDLEELKGTEGLDVDHITHIRIIDVIGSVGSAGSKDQLGQPINDPYPTPFGTGGFDLDAVAAIHMSGTGISSTGTETASIFPNPASDEVHITLPVVTAPATLALCDLSGKVILRQEALIKNIIPISGLQSGLYLVGIIEVTGIQWIGKCSKI